MEDERKTEGNADAARQNEPEKEESQMQWMPIFMCLGLSIGMSLGSLLFDNLPVGMCMGLAAGVAVGSMIDARNRAKAKAEQPEPCDKENQEEDSFSE